MRTVLSNMALLLLCLLLLVGCKSTGSEETDTPSLGNSHTEYITAYADRPIRVPITNIPSAIDWNYYPKVSGDHITEKGARAALLEESNEFYFVASSGFIGTRTVTFELTDKRGGAHHTDWSTFYKTYTITTKEPPLEGNRDFILQYVCDTEVDSQAASSDINIVNDNLSNRQNVYSRQTYHGKLPKYSRVQVDYLGISSEESQIHHDLFKNNTDGHLLITCHYFDGSKSFIFPIGAKEWYANRVNVGTGSSRTYIRNDIYIYISSLSDLHAKIYKKIYDKTLDNEEAYDQANKFMERNFPAGHYTVELGHDYNSHPDSFDFYDTAALGEENNEYYESFALLAEESGIDSVYKLMDQIANNYESFYLGDREACLEPMICASFFPEYTESLTINQDFSDGLNSWVVEKSISGDAFEEVKTSDTNDSIILILNTHSSSDDPVSWIEVYQSAYLSELRSIDSFYLHFDLRNLIGTSTGFSLGACIGSSGLTGVYAALYDASGNQIGLLTWTDHCNKFDAAWVSSNGFNSTNTFYNTRMREVIRRVTPSEKSFIYTASLGRLLSTNLPEVYERRNEISTIKYGIFATEHRSASGTCYYCSTELEAKEIRLLKSN